jgi:inactivated superfamily I helicase
MRPDESHSPTRRKLLLAAGALGLAGIGWLGLRPYDRKSWIEATLRKYLPGISIEAESLAKFTTEMSRSQQFNDTRQRVALWMDHALPNIARHLPKAGDRIDRMERQVVSDFLTGSNFFRVADPKHETIFYAGAIPACGNPFARFRDS